MKIEKWRNSKSAVLVAVCLGIFIDAMAYSICVPFLPFVLDSPIEIGSLLACYGAGIIVSSPLIGIWSDSLGKRKPLIIFSLFILVLGTVLFAFLQSYQVWIVARIIQGIASGMMWTLGLAL